MLAATLSPSYGIYSGLREPRGHRRSRPAARSTSTRRSTRPRSARLDGPLLPLVRRLNEIRRASPRARRIDVRFLETANPALIAYAKGRGVGAIIVCRERRPALRPGGHRDGAGDLGLPDGFTRPRPGDAASVYRWCVGRQLRRLDPAVTPCPRAEGGGMSVDGRRIEQDIALLAARDHHEPHRVLGRAPGARAAWRCAPGGPRRRRCGRSRRAASRWSSSTAPPASSPGCSPGATTRAALRDRGGARAATPCARRDPYSFLPTLGELDLHLVGEGRHEELWERLGAHPREIDGAAGHGLRGLGAGGALGERGRRLERLGRPGAPDALARARRASGSCSCPASARAPATSTRSAAPTGRCA